MTARAWEKFMATRMTIPPRALCGCITDAPPGKLSAILENAAVDLLEWRLDAAIHFHSLEAALQGIPLLSRSNRLPVVATHRPVSQGGHFSGPEKERMDLLQKAADAGAEWVDLEEGTPEAMVRTFQRKGTQVLLSSHDFSGTPPGPSLRDLAKKMARKNPDAVKIVTLAGNSEDCLRVLELIPFGQRELGLDVIAFAMGASGRWSRPASLLLGSPWAYVQLPGQPAAAPGQLEADEMRRLLAMLVGEAPS